MEHQTFESAISGGGGGGGGSSSSSSSSSSSIFSRVNEREEEVTINSVKAYYGDTLKTSEDLQTNACCCSEPPPTHIIQAMRNIHPEVSAKYYGCGLVIPDVLANKVVLDLGCGAGRDCYIISQLVGQEGHVVGVDMTESQLSVATNYRDWHASKFQHSRSNCDFKLGQIEHLDKLGLDNETFDVIVSNCVINLCANKRAVLTQAYNLLKVGGELYFSDVYSNRRVPQSLREDPVLWGECLSGALYWNDFNRLAKDCGFIEAPRLVECSVITINNAEIEAKLAGYSFYSATYRLFKVHGMEPDNENYGHKVSYLGTIDRQPDEFKLDENFTFATGVETSVCGNTFKILKQSRFSAHFSFSDSLDGFSHQGIFNESRNPFDKASISSSGDGGGSCCAPSSDDNDCAGGL